MVTKDRHPFPSQSTQDDPCVYWDDQQTSDRLSNLHLTKSPVASTSATPSPLESRTVVPSQPKKPQAPLKNTFRHCNSVKSLGRTLLKRKDSPKEKDNSPSDSHPSTSSAEEPSKIIKNNSTVVRLPNKAKFDELLSRLVQKPCQYGRVYRRPNNNSHRSRSSCSVKTRKV